MNETSDPLSISSIDTDPFDVYSYPPGKLGIFEIGVSPYFWYVYDQIKHVYSKHILSYS